MIGPKDCGMRSHQEQVGGSQCAIEMATQIWRLLEDADWKTEQLDL